MSPTLPRIALVLLAVVAVALAAGSGPVDGPPGADELPEPYTPNAGEEQTSTPPGGGGSPTRGLPTALVQLFGGALGLAVLVAAVVVYRALSGSAGAVPDSAADPEPDESDVAPSTLDAVGGTAGRTADRLEHGGEFDNEVFRAWKEMTDRLRVSNRPARTPGEFADAAEQAGMDREDVRDLTTLFESVRYGAADPTEADERRAVALLRRIESKYGAEQG